MLLRAALALALTDAGIATPIWSWPDGTVLVDHEAHPIDVRALALDALESAPGEPHQLARLRTLLEAQGLDLTAPLWLDGGSVDLPERALMAFPSYHWLVRGDAVISDRGVRVFSKGGLAAGRQPKVQVRHAEVVGATIGPGLLWGQWRLKLRTPERVVRVRGMGDGRKQAQAAPGAPRRPARRPLARRPARGPWGALAPGDRRPPVRADPDRYRCRHGRPADPAASPAPTPPSSAWSGWASSASPPSRTCSPPPSAASADSPRRLGWLTGSKTQPDVSDYRDFSVRGTRRSGGRARGARRGTPRRRRSPP